MLTRAGRSSGRIHGDEYKSCAWRQMMTIVCSGVPLGKRQFGNDNVSRFRAYLAQQRCRLPLLAISRCVRWHGETIGGWGNDSGVRASHAHVMALQSHLK
jgi:hypothetical protein